MTSTNTTLCPFCREEIQSGALKCKHCKSTIVNMSQARSSSWNQVSGGKSNPWFYLPSVVLGVLCFLASLDDHLSADDVNGIFMFGVLSIVLGIVNLNTKTKENGGCLSTIGIILSTIGMLIVLSN